jgi:hypothetical protein
MLRPRAGTEHTRRAAESTRVGGDERHPMWGHVLGHLPSAVLRRTTEFTRHKDVACNT